MDSNSNKIRLAKFISNAGYCSRRNAEILIAQEKVRVNNAMVNTPLYFVDEKDFIEIDGQQLKKQKTEIWLYYKPVKVITSHKDNKSRKYNKFGNNNEGDKNHDRKTVFNEVKKHIKQHVISVGRLDYMSEGLLILTNDPKVAHFFERPENKISRTYLVITHSKLPEFSINKMKNQIKIDGVVYKNVAVNLVDFMKEKNGKEIYIQTKYTCEGYAGTRNQKEKDAEARCVETSMTNKNSIYHDFLSKENFHCKQTIKNIKNGKYNVYEVVLTEGKNREIRKIFFHFQVKIAKLIRFSYGNFSLLMNNKTHHDCDALNDGLDSLENDLNNDIDHKKYIQPNQVSKHHISYSFFEKLFETIS